MVEILLATSTGERKYEVKEENLKNYGQITRRGRTVYARRIRVVSGKTGRITKRAITNRKAYIYDTQKRGYVKYERTKTITVKTRDGRRLITHEQLRYLFKKQKGVYVQKQKSDFYMARVSKTIQRGQQLRISQKFKINNRVIVVRGFSRVQPRHGYSMQELKKQAQSMLRARLAEEYEHITGTMYAYEESLMKSKPLGRPNMAIRQWVYMG